MCSSERRHLKGRAGWTGYRLHHHRGRRVGCAHLTSRHVVFADSLNCQRMPWSANLPCLRIDGGASIGFLYNAHPARFSWGRGLLALARHRPVAISFARSFVPFIGESSFWRRCRVLQWAATNAPEAYFKMAPLHTIRTVRLERIQDYCVASGSAPVVCTVFTHDVETALVSSLHRWSFYVFERARLQSSAKRLK